MQTMSLENEFLCSNCKCKNSEEVKETNDDNLYLQLVPVYESPLVDNKSKQIVVPKAVEKVLAGAIRREMALEEYCTKQNAEIMQLNRLAGNKERETITRVKKKFIF